MISQMPKLISSPVEPQTSKKGVQPIFLMHPLEFVGGIIKDKCTGCYFSLAQALYLRMLNQSCSWPIVSWVRLYIASFLSCRV